MTLECDGCGRLHPACSCHREKPMKQDATRKIAAQYIAGEATLEELDDAVFDERIRKRDAEIEKLRQEVKSLRELGWEDARYLLGIFRENSNRIIELERLNNRPGWKKLLGMK